MNELNKGQKMVKMVELMRRVGGVRAQDLMERFDLDPRSLRRYLSDLRDLGLPLEDDGRSDERVISLDARWRRTGVQLTLAELLSLHFGRRLFTFLDGTSFASDMDEAIERLEPAVSRAHRDLATQLDMKFLAVAEHAKNYGGDVSDVIDDVVTALVYNNPLDVQYRKTSGVESRYLLHPYTLAVFRQALYLFAFDAKANQVKTFAIERFTKMARRRQDHFEVVNGWRPEAHMAHAFGIISGPPEWVTVVFAPQVAAYIRERTWHPTQTYQVLPDGWLELRMNVAVTVELVIWILGFGAEAKVVGPESLVDRVVSSLSRAVDHYA